MLCGAESVLTPGTEPPVAAWWLGIVGSRGVVRGNVNVGGTVAGRRVGTLVVGDEADAVGAVLVSPAVAGVETSVVAIGNACVVVVTAGADGVWAVTCDGAGSGIAMLGPVAGTAVGADVVTTAGDIEGA